MLPIKLNDILAFEDLLNVKVRFNNEFDGNRNPIELFNEGKLPVMLAGQYWNFKASRSYREGQTTIGFVRIKPGQPFWLLFHVGRVTKDLNILNNVGYEYEELTDYYKYVGRLIIRYENKVQRMIRAASAVFEECEVVQILPSVYDSDLFPGYEKVNINWKSMKYLLEKQNWQTALENQKGVYLITDISNGKKYVGSAYGEHMILGRWNAYLKSGHGGNIELKNISFNHIKENFRYSILEIFKAAVDDNVVLEREAWWKNVLQTRTFGYNRN